MEATKALWAGRGDRPPSFLRRRPSHRGPEPDEVAVAVDVGSLVLSPVSVLRPTNTDTGRLPLSGQLVGVVEPKVGDTGGGRGVQIMDQRQMDFDSIAGRVPGSSAFVLAH